MHLVLIGPESGADQPLDTFGRRRLEMCGPTARVDRLLRAIGTMVVGEHVLAEPDSQLLDVLLCRLAKVQGLADLEPVIGQGAAGPGVLRVQFGRETELLGDIDDSSSGDIAFVVREAAIMLKELEQQGEPQPRRACLVGDQLSITTGQSPVFRQLVGCPLPLHVAASSPCSLFPDQREVPRIAGVGTVPR